MTSHDILAIGDIVTDAFIRLSDAHIHKNVSEVNRELCIRYGDKVPYDSVEVVSAVGNSPNAAVSAARLGLSSALYTNLGDDLWGKEDLAVLKKEGVSTDFVITHENRASNYHYVLWFKADRTILIKHEVYPYHMPEIGSPKWVYLSSLGATSLDFHHEISEYLKNHKDVRLAFQPGTYQMEFGKEQLSDIYNQAEVVFCNREEAMRILEVKDNEIAGLLSGMRGLGAKIAVITDGPDGAYMATDNGNYFMPAFPDPDGKPPFERTGAGDAFASTFISALALGESPETALMWAPINSMSVVRKVGAQAGLLTIDELRAYLSKAPETYILKKL